jgi:hypothetical protein
MTINDICTIYSTVGNKLQASLISTKISLKSVDFVVREKIRIVPTYDKSNYKWE